MKGRTRPPGSSGSSTTGRMVGGGGSNSICSTLVLDCLHAHFTLIRYKGKEGVMKRPQLRRSILKKKKPVRAYDCHGPALLTDLNSWVLTIARSCKEFVK